MTVQITYFVHGTTQDNIDHLASGHNDIVLSARGIEEAKKLGTLVKEYFDVVITSDLQRAIDTARLAFSNKFPLLQDKRLRECDYGILTQKHKDWDISEYIIKKYPRGESYKDVEKRMNEFIAFLKERFNGKHIAIVAHQGPQLALEVLTKHKTWEQAIAEDWRNTKEWRPGWKYVITD